MAFALGAAPGLTGYDAGELGAAAWELGVAHPPGFPTALIIDHFVMRLLPWGEIGLRGNLASAFVAAVALGILYASARRLDTSPWSAAAGAALAGASGLLAPHATAIEVYAGSALWTAIAVWLRAALSRTGDRRYVVGLGLLVGLGLGHHGELRLLALPLVVEGAVALTRRRELRTAGWSALAGLAGAAVIAYLPLRAAADPWRNWGDPSSAGAVWAHLTGRRIFEAYAAQIGTFDLDAIAQYAGGLAHGAAALLALGIAGFALALAHPAVRYAAVAWVLDTTYAVVINPMGIADGQNGAPAAVLLGLGAALAVNRAARVLANWRVPEWAVAGTLIIVALVLAPQLDRGDQRGPALLINEALHRAPPDAVVFVVSDFAAAGLAWAQVVEGARPDAAVIVRQHAWDASSIDPVRRRCPDALGDWSPVGGLSSLHVLRDPTAPVIWEWARGTDRVQRPSGLVPYFPWFSSRAIASGPPFAEQFIAFAAHLPAAAWSEPGFRDVAAGLWLDIGFSSVDAGDIASAVDAFAQATEIAPESAAAWTNLGNAYAMGGDYGAAVDATRRALTHDPNGPMVQRNLARFLMHLGELDLAISLLDQRLASEATDAEALGLRGIAHARAARYGAADRDFRAALAVDSAQPEARHGLDTLHGGPQRLKPEAGDP